MAVGKKPAAGPLKGKKKAATFVIDCSKPVEDKIMKIGEFEKFLVDKIKVDNKTGTSLSVVSCLSKLDQPVLYASILQTIYLTPSPEEAP